MPFCVYMTYDKYGPHIQMSQKWGSYTAQKMKFSIKNFLLNGKLHFLCSVNFNMLYNENVISNNCLYRKFVVFEIFKHLIYSFQLAGKFEP